MRRDQWEKTIWSADKVQQQQRPKDNYLFMLWGRRMLRLPAQFCWQCNGRTFFVVDVCLTKDTYWWNVFPLLDHSLIRSTFNHGWQPSVGTISLMPFEALGWRYRGLLEEIVKKINVHLPCHSSGWESPQEVYLPSTFQSPPMFVLLYLWFLSINKAPEGMELIHPYSKGSIQKHFDYPGRGQ